MIIQQVLLLVLLWVCLLHPSLTAMVFTRTTDHQPKSFMARGPGNDGKALHRQKRGWMWNQFFLLEEYTGSDYQYVGKVGLRTCSHTICRCCCHFACVNGRHFVSSSDRGPILPFSPIQLKSQLPLKHPQLSFCIGFGRRN